MVLPVIRVIMSAKADEERKLVKVPVSLRKRIKIDAAKRGMPMMDYIEKAVTLMEREP